MFKELIFLLICLIGFNVNSMSLEEQLIEAVKDNNKSQILSLINQGANIDSADIYGDSALYWAAGQGLMDIAEFLLDLGANVNVKSFNNSTPLHAAAANGHKEIIKLLLDNGANASAKNIYGETAADFDANNCDEEIIEL